MSQETFTEQLRKIFLENGVCREYQPGQMLVERGQPATHICFIASGQARTFCANPAGDDITLFYLDAESMICSEALGQGGTVRVNVQAITQVEMYRVPASRFLQQWTAAGYAIQDLFDPLISRLTLLSDYICCAHFRENPKRVAYFLYSCYTRTGPLVEFRNWQIAEITGIIRVAVNRILNHLAKNGIVELGYRKIRILNVEELEKVFHSVGYFID